MKIRPLESEVPCDELRDLRMNLSNAIERNDTRYLEVYFRKWNEVVIDYENTRSNSKGTLVMFSSFRWSHNTMKDYRFETACVAYALGRSLYKNGENVLAFQFLGEVLERLCSMGFSNTTKWFRSTVAMRLRSVWNYQIQFIKFNIRLPRDLHRLHSACLWLRHFTMIWADVEPKEDHISEVKQILTSLQATVLLFTEKASPKMLAKVSEWDSSPFQFEIVPTSKSEVILSETLPKVGRIFSPEVWIPEYS